MDEERLTEVSAPESLMEWMVRKMPKPLWLLFGAVSVGAPLYLGVSSSSSAQGETETLPQASENVYEAPSETRGVHSQAALFDATGNLVCHIKKHVLYEQPKETKLEEVKMIPNNLYIRELASDQIVYRSVKLADLLGEAQATREVQDHLESVLEGRVEFEFVATSTENDGPVSSIYYMYGKSDGLVFCNYER